MVQRKLSAKLTLQLDHATTQPLSLSPHHHHHDVKSPRGAAAKKMKKSGSTKRPKQPRKPPPLSKTAPTPNYMKSTTSSDARKESPQSNTKKGSSSIKKPMKIGARTLTKNPSFKPARTAAVRKRGPVVICENLDAQRATCSSTLKDSKFPAFLSLNPGGTESLGTSSAKVCPYTYCSLNGHHHAPLPPLKCFLSARRRAVKTQKSLKLGCVSPRPVDDVLKEQKEEKDFFVQIYTADGGGVDEREDQEERVCDEFEPCQEVSVEEERDEGFLNESSVKRSVDDVFYEQDSDGSEMEWERDYCLPLQLDYGQECLPQTDVLEAEVIKEEEEFMVKSEGKDCCVDEFLADKASQVSFDEEGFSSDAFSSSNDGETNDLDDDDDDDDPKNLSTYETSAPLQVPVKETEESGDEASGVLLEEAVAVTGDEATVAGHHSFSKVEGKNAAEGETEDVLFRFKANSKKVVDDDDEVGAFNPRGPNFLPVEADPEAEKVDLRHQDLDERKNAEEWMVDYALRQVVTNLGPARKRKVSLLVEAFEKVMPANKWDLQLRHGSAFDQTRPIQACR